MHRFVLCTFRSWRIALLGIALVTLAASAGCLRQRLLSEETGFRDHPAMPRQNFGRPGERRGQAGLDDRSRQIESSLGIEGDPPRLFDR